MSSQQEKTRLLILEKYEENKKRTHKTIAKLIGVTRQLVGKVLKQFYGTMTTTRKKESGKKKGPHDKKKDKMIVATILKKRGLSFWSP